MSAFDNLFHTQKQKRVVLIGCTGHGKGTLGNFLYNLRKPKANGSSLPFEESESLNPHTQEPSLQRLMIENSPNASEHRKSSQFCILDTPGLNDIGREKYLQHMISVLRMIGTEFRGVHSLVLVYRFKTRIDAAIGPALRYYRDLFAPLFKAQSAILVLTHISSEDYEIALGQNEWDSCVKTHLDECNRILELDKPSWNCPIVRCYFVNSKWAPSKIEDLLQRINTNGHFEENDLLYRSYLMREQILDYISTAPEVILDTHVIPLPPALETERINALKIIDGRIEDLLKTVAVEDELRATQFTSLQELRTKSADMKNKIDEIEARIEALSDIQKTPSTYVAGDDWIRVRSAGKHTVNAPCDSTSSCGGCKCKYQFEAHNASHPSNHPVNEGRTWRAKVNPNFLNFRQKENRYWSYRSWPEYNGSEHNATILKDQRLLLSKLKEDSSKVSHKLQQIEENLDIRGENMAEHNANLRKLDDDKKYLLPTEFKNFVH